MELANLALELVILAVVLAPYLRYLRPRSANAVPDPVQVDTPAPVPSEELPEGHAWPDKFDEFDGVFERFVCRAHGESHLRRRV